MCVVSSSVDTRRPLTQGACLLLMSFTITLCTTAKEILKKLPDAGTCLIYYKPTTSLFTFLAFFFLLLLTPHCS